MDATRWNEFGRRLRKARISRGLSQKELGLPLCTSAYVSQLETGRRRPSQRVIDHLAEKLEVDAEELLTGRSVALEPELLVQIHEAKVLLYQGRSEEARTRLQRAARKAKANKLPAAEAQAEEALAILHEREGDLAAALSGFQRTQDLLRNEPLPLQAEAVAGIARCIQMDGDVSYGVYVLETYLGELLREPAPDPTALMRTYAALAHAYFGAGFSEKAVDAADKARSYEARSDDPQQVACMYVNVARAMLHEKHYSESLNALAQAAECFRSLDWKVLEARTKINQGIVFVEKDELDSAASALTEALALLKEAPSRFDEAAALTELGRVARLSGDSKDALEHLNHALKLVDVGDLPQRARIHRELGLTFEKVDQTKALDHLRNSVDLFRTSKQPIEVAVTLGRIAEFMRQNNDLEGALGAYEETVETVRELTFG